MILKIFLIGALLFAAAAAQAATPAHIAPTPDAEAAPIAATPPGSGAKPTNPCPGRLSLSLTFPQIQGLLGVLQDQDMGWKERDSLRIVLTAAILDQATTQCVLLRQGRQK